jgi:hypothetical protein
MKIVQADLNNMEGKYKGERRVPVSHVLLL